MRQISLLNGQVSIVVQGIDGMEVHRNGMWAYDIKPSERLIKALVQRVADLEDINDDLQSKIDSLMLEYCPEDMSEAQVEEWARHQVVSPVTLGYNLELDE